MKHINTFDDFINESFFKSVDLAIQISKLDHNAPDYDKKRKTLEAKLRKAEREETEKKKLMAVAREEDRVKEAEENKAKAAKRKREEKKEASKKEKEDNEHKERMRVKQDKSDEIDKNVASLNSAESDRVSKRKNIAIGVGAAAALGGLTYAAIRLRRRSREKKLEKYLAQYKKETDPEQKKYLKEKIEDLRKKLKD